MSTSNSYTSFIVHQHLATGSLQTIALAVKKLLASDPSNAALIFDNTTGRTIDIDTRGTDEEICARFPDSTVSEATSNDEDPTEAKGRGRPKLGVVAREITLLPRHWEWLAAQPGGASVALRKLVEEARRATSDKDKARKAQERTYHFILAIAGDLPGFEEATRALFANDPQKFRELIAAWPTDVKNHALDLASGDTA